MSDSELEATANPSAKPDRLPEAPPADGPHRLILERYRSLVEDTADGFYAFDAPSGRLIFLNRRGGELLGLTPEEAFAHCLWDFIVPEERPRFMQRLQALLAGKPLQPSRQVYTLLRRGAATFRAEVSTEKTRFESRDGVQGNIRDVTDYEKFQQRIDEFQRMETVAAMAGGIAHQFETAVQVIRSNLQKMESHCPGDAVIAQCLAQIRGATHRIGELSGNLTAYARGGYPQPEAIVLNAFIDDVLPLIRHTAPPGIRFVVGTAPDLPPVLADRAQLRMALAAVITNAEEAIESKGRILISTSREQFQPPFFELHPDLKPVDYVCLSVADTGKGMDERTRRRVCEPFFTTKFQGRGLGMAAVYGIVKRHNGWLSIDSKPGRGTTVRIYLPVGEAPR